MSMDQGSVDLYNVCKSFGNTKVLRDVSLSVQPGEVVSIIGPSGAGKSTLLRCVNLLELPTSGTIAVNGTTLYADQPTIKQAELARVRAKIGMVFQSFNLFPHLTVLRNVSLPQMRVLGLSRREAERRSHDLLNQVGLADKHDSYPRRCSGGQQQRIAIARTLALEPSVMLFDEPTSALDAELGHEVLQVMRSLADRGITMMVVTHALHFAEDVSDRVVVMADGAIIESGRPAQVLKQPSHPRTQQFLRAALDR